MKEWLKKKEYELYMYLKSYGTLNITVTDLAKTLNTDKGDTCRRLKALEQKDYIIRNGTYILIK